MVEHGIGFGVGPSASANIESTSARFTFLGRRMNWKALGIVIRAPEGVALAELEVISDDPMSAKRAQEQPFNLTTKSGLSSRCMRKFA